MIRRAKIIGKRYGLRAHAPDGAVIATMQLSPEIGQDVLNGAIPPRSLLDVPEAAYFSTVEHDLLDTPSGWIEDGVVYQDRKGMWWLCRNGSPHIAPHELTGQEDVDKVAVESPDQLPDRPWPDVTVQDGAAFKRIGDGC